MGMVVRAGRLTVRDVARMALVYIALSLQAPKREHTAARSLPRARCRGL
jgi:hypothetical protein